MENYDSLKNEFTEILKALTKGAYYRNYSPQDKKNFKRVITLTHSLWKEDRQIIHDVLFELTNSTHFNYFRFWEGCLKWPKAIPVLYLKNGMPRDNIEFYLKTDFSKTSFHDNKIYKGYFEDKNFILEIAYIYKWNEDGKRGWDQLARRSKLIFHDVKHVYFFFWKNYVNIQSKKTKLGRLRGNSMYNNYEIPFSENAMIEQRFKFVDKIDYNFVNYRFFYFWLNRDPYSDIYRMGIVAKDWELKKGEKMGSLSYAIRPNR